MKKFLFTLALALALPGLARAEQANFEVGYSSIATTGIACTTVTVVQINATRPTGFRANIAGYRITNQDSADAVWIGGPYVSTSTLQIGSSTDFANLGEKLAAGASAPYALGKEYQSVVSSAGAPLVRLYCKAADAAGAAGAVISIVWFGY